jgi:hypothetical protein
MRELPVAETRGMVVGSWRVTEAGLVLRVSDGPEEFRLQCICGRCHWIVREHVDGDVTRLLVTCHSCGTKASILMRASAVPAR